MPRGKVMRIGRVATVMLGMDAIFAEPVRSRGRDWWDSIFWKAPKPSKSKPNKVSQSKRRKYKRQGRG